MNENRQMLQQGSQPGTLVFWPETRCQAEGWGSFMVEGGQAPGES